MSICIEKAQVVNLEKLYSIEKECFALEAFSKGQIKSLLQNPNSISLLARIDNEIVGFVIGLIFEKGNKKVGHVFTLNVRVGARRRRVGLRMLEDLERILKHKGVKVCFLEAKVDNVAACELYKKLGYVEIGPLKDYYRSGGDGIRLRKVL